MSDLVNEFFRKHYPPDAATAWEMQWCVGEMAKSYTGAAGHGASIFPEMVCVDGFAMSVQGHFGGYSHPRDDFADHYSAVEVLCPAEPLLDEHGGHECGDKRIYGYVPIAIIAAVVAKHGGLRAGQ